MTCPQCNALISQNDTVCPICNIKLAEQNDTQKNDDTVKINANRKVDVKSSKLTVVGAILSALVIFCFAVSFLFDSGSIVKVENLNVMPRYNEVWLTWEELPEADGYAVYQYDYTREIFEQIDTTTETKFIVTGLKEDAEYKFAIKAFCVENDELLLSKNFATVKTKTVAEPYPAKPQNLIATPRYNEVKLVWDAVPDAVGYRIYQYDYDKKSSNRIDTISDTSYIITKLQADTQYRFSIKAYTIVDGEKLWSEVYSMIETTTQKEPYPDKPQKLVATPKTNEIKLTWSAVEGAVGYRVYQYDYQKGKSDKLATITEESYTVKNLKPNTNYRFSVKAYTIENGKKLWSEVVTIVETKTTN